MTPSTPGYQQAYPFPPQPVPVQDPANNYPSVTPYGPPPDPAAWGYPGSPSLDRSDPYGRTALPPIHTLGRPNADEPGAGSIADIGYDHTSPADPHESWHVASAPRDEADAYRTWPDEQHAFPPLEHSPPSAVGPALREPSVPPSNAQNHPTWSTSPIDPYPNARYSVVSVPGPVPSQSVPAPAPPQAPQPVDTSMYASASYAQQQHQQQQQAHAQASFQHPGGYAPQQDHSSPSTIPPLPRHTYTRTLVGPLSANACRLLDEHRKPGIFFLFQDLSIRTEGA
jgi:hypothetical protein